MTEALTLLPLIYQPTSWRAEVRLHNSQQEIDATRNYTPFPQLTTYTQCQAIMTQWEERFPRVRHRQEQVMGGLRKPAMNRMGAWRYQNSERILKRDKRWSIGMVCRSRSSLK